MKRFLAIWLVLFCLTPLFLFACGKTDAPESETDTMVLTNVYAAAPVSAPEMDVWIGFRLASGPEDSLYLYDAIQGTYIYRFSPDGAYQETISVPMPTSGDWLFSGIAALPDGEFLALASDALRTFFLLRMDADGNILHRAEVEDADTTSLIGVANGSFYCVVNNVILRYSDVLTETKRFTLDFMPTALRTICGEEDTVYLCDMMGSLYILDCENGGLTPVYVPELFNNDAAAYPGNGYLWYYVDSEGIFGVNGDEKTLLCSFGNSNLSYRGIQELAVLSPTAFYIKYQAPTANGLEYLLLTPSEDVRERIPLRIAWHSASDTETMRNIVSSFNVSGTDYFVELVDYAKYGLSGIDPPGAQMFQKDLLAGEVFDLYCVRNGELFGDWEKTGALADLSSVCDDNLLPSVRAAYETKDGIFGLPFTVLYNYLAMPATRTSSLTDIEKASVESAADRDTIVCIDYTIYRMIHVFTSSILDSADCRFDTPEFQSFLETLKLVSENCGTRYGTVQTIHYDTYKELRYGGSSMEAAVREDRLKYLYLASQDPKMLAIYKVIYGDTPVRLSGYPTVNGGTAASGTANPILCVPKTGNITGAKAFLSFFLSDRIQCNRDLLKENMPITESGLIKTTEARYFYFSKERANVIKLYDSYATQPSAPLSTLVPNIFEVTLTDEEVEVFRDLIRNASISSGRDNMVMQIVEEEIEPFFAGDRTAQTTADIIQKRASVYLAE